MYSLFKLKTFYNILNNILKIIFQLQLLQNIDYVLCVVHYILESNLPP